MQPKITRKMATAVRLHFFINTEQNNFLDEAQSLHIGIQHNFVRPKLYSTERS